MLLNLLPPMLFKLFHRLAAVVGEVGGDNRAVSGRAEVLLPDLDIPCANPCHFLPIATKLAVAAGDLGVAAG